MWIVTVIKWVMSRNGRPKVTHCNSRAYRLEEYARGRYDAVVESIEKDGFVLTPLKVPIQEEYEGVQGYQFRERKDGESTVYITVFIDRNPS